MKFVAHRGSVRRSFFALSAVLLAVALGACGGGAKTTNDAPASVAADFTSLAPDVFEPCGMAAVTGSVWVLGCSGRMVRVSESGEVRAGSRLDGGISALRALVADRSAGLWALATSGEGRSLRGSVVRLDPSSGAPLVTIALGTSVASHAVVAFGTLWVATLDGGLYSVHGEEARLAAKESPLVSVVADDEALWTISEGGAVTKRIASGASVRTFPDVNPHSIAAAASLGSVWIAGSERGVTRLDPTTGAVKSLDVPGTVNDIVPCGGSIWLSRPDHGLRAVDAAGVAVRDVTLSVGPHYLLCAGERLWILTEDGRIGSIGARA